MFCFAYKGSLAELAENLMSFNYQFLFRALYIEVKLVMQKLSYCEGLSTGKMSGYISN